jgi:hypothetical protein
MVYLNDSLEVGGSRLGFALETSQTTILAIAVQACLPLAPVLSPVITGSAVPAHGTPSVYGRSDPFKISKPVVAPHPILVITLESFGTGAYKRLEH